jgi:hypothetical protein
LASEAIWSNLASVDGTGGMDCAIADPERRAVEHFFRRGIDPVQVFKDHQRRLLP